MYLIEEDEYTDDFYFNDWFEFVKNLRKSQLSKNLNKFAATNLIGNKLKLLKSMNNIKFKFTELFLNLSEMLKFSNLFNLKNKKLFNHIYYYNKINYNKLKIIKNKNYYSNYNKIILILDTRPIKPKIFLIFKNKCILTLTSGIIYKKLNMKKKKTKKSEKMLNLMLKSVYIKIQQTVLCKNIIIHLKGTKSNIFNVLVSVSNNFKDKNIFMMYSPKIGFNKYKFKKLKSIKRRLRKRFSKLIKN